MAFATTRMTASGALKNVVLETLDKLGLDYISEDFVQRGILRDNEEASSKENSAEKERD